MASPILEQLLSQMHEQPKLKQYIARNVIPLDVFAEFVSLFKNDSNTTPTTWESFYYECIPAYFHSDGGKKSMEAFIKEGCKNEKTFKYISSLLTYHPRFNYVHNGHVKEEDMSVDDKLLYNAFKKLASIKETGIFTNAIVEGIKGKWEKPKPDYSEQAKQIAKMWKTSDGRI